MLLEIFSVYDEKAGAYLNPFFFPNVTQAERAMLDIMHDENHSFFRFASDYTLRSLGTIDNVTGKIESSIITINAFTHYRSTLLAKQSIDSIRNSFSPEKG